MSILSTSSKLVRVGDSYSAGEGISIENHVISVTGDYGHSYYPGENISISDDNVISSKDWSSDIDTAVQNASAETTAWVSEQGYITDASLSDYALITDVETTSGLLKMDIDTVSGSISGKMDSTAFNDWQNGQYANDIGGLANDVNAVSGAVDAISGAVSSLDIPTRQDIENASGYAYSQSTAWCDNQGYLTQHQDISYLATKNEVDTVSSFLSGAIDYVSANAGDEFPASANDAITAYQTYSGDYLTNQDISNLATKDEVSAYTLTTTLEQVSGDIVSQIPSIEGLATTGDLNTASSFLSGAIDYVSANAGDEFPVSADEAIQYVQGNSATIDNVNSTVQTNSAQWAEGTSVDTVPVAVISPLVTGFSGESAYLGIESTALNLSSYVPVSAIGVDSNYGWVNKISGRNISAYNAATAKYAYTANRSYLDRNGNEITSYYQPKLTITGDAGTITSINGSAVGASIPEGWELVAGAGIEIVDDAENNQTTISVTAAGGNPEVESYVQTNSASIDDAVSTYQSNSGSYITQETDWTNTITAASSYAYSEAVAQIPAPFDPTYISGVIDNKLDKSDSANFYPMTGNPSGFLTTHQDISNKLDTTAFSDVSGTFLTAVNIPESANWGDATTAYQTNSATYMTEPNLEYNAVNEISAYNGSAIAQYGAEKQWLVHDDTLVHAANSAQYALGVNVSAVQTLMGVDETVLWSGTLAWGQTASLTDSVKNYDRIRFYIEESNRHRKSTNELVLTDLSNTGLREFSLNMLDATTSYFGNYFTVYDLNEAGDALTSVSGRQWWYSPWTSTAINGSTDRGLFLKKVVGIGRKQ